MDTYDKELKFIKFSKAYHNPGGKSKFPGDQTELTSLRICWHPDSDVFMGRERAESQEEGISPHPLTSVHVSQREK